METPHLTSTRFITLFLSAALFITPALSQYLATQANLDAWLATTNAAIRYTGADFSSPLGPQDARIIYCTEYDHDRKICGSGGECFAYQGPVSRCMKPEKMYQCVAAFNTNVCMGYDADCTVANQCIFTATCEDRLADGFCLGIDSVSLGFPDPVDNPRQPPPPPQPTSSSRAPQESSTPSSTSSSTPSESSATLTSSDNGSSTLPTTRRSASFETLLVSSGSESSPSSSSTGSTVPGTSTSKDDTGERSDGSSLPIGGMVGIALGGVLVGIALILLVLYIRRLRKRASRTSPSNIPVLLTPITVTAQHQPSLDSPPPAQYYTKSYQDSPHTDSAAGLIPNFATSTSAFESFHDHSDSGVQLASSAREAEPGPRARVELPPPYSQA